MSSDTLTLNQNPTTENIKNDSQNVPQIYSTDPDIINSSESITLIEIKGETSDNPDIIIDSFSIKMAARKAKLLEEKPVYESRSWIADLLTNKRVMIFLCASLMFTYLLIGQLISWIQYISEILVFTLMPIKIALHVFSSDSDLRKHMDTMITETNDMKELKIAHKQTKKIKRMRLDYAGTLLRQILVVTVIRILIMLVPILTIMPITCMISHYIHISLIFLTILVQTPTTMLNFFISLITEKLNIRSHDFYLECPLSDKIVMWIKTLISDTKISSIRTIRDILLKYDGGADFSTEDGNLIIDSLNTLGISKETLKKVGIDPNNMDKIIGLIKEKIANGLQIISDGNTSISDLMTNVVNKNTSDEERKFQIND